MSEAAQNRAYEVEFLNCIVDKANDFMVVDSDSHFAEFVGVHPSKIRQGKLFLQDVIKPADRQNVLRRICKKDSRYVYMDFDMINRENELVFVHCTAQNYEDSSLCRLVFADVSKSRNKTKELEEQAKEINNLIELVASGVCLFKVTPNMHFEVLYMNNSCCRLFGTTQDKYQERVYRIDELIHPDDKTLVFQAIGKTVATGEPLDLEYRVMTHKNYYSWCKCNAEIHKYDASNSPVFHAVFTDISRIMQAEERADKANEKLVNLLKNLSGAIFFTTPEKPFACDLISGDFVRLTGYKRSDFFERLSGDLARIIVDDPAAVAAEINAGLAKGGKCRVSYSIKSKNGDIIRVSDSRKLISQEDGSMALICELETAD